MHIQFLYFNECPNHEKAFRLLQEILKEQQVNASIERIEIKTDGDAVGHEFIGSPTIRIDGIDVESATDSRPYAKTCRVYLVDGKFSGLPSRRMIENSLWAAEMAKFEGFGCC